MANNIISPMSRDIDSVKKRLSAILDTPKNYFTGVMNNMFRIRDLSDATGNVENIINAFLEGNPDDASLFKLKAILNRLAIRMPALFNEPLLRLTEIYSKYNDSSYKKAYINKFSKDNNIRPEIIREGYNEDLAKIQGLIKKINATRVAVSNRLRQLLGIVNKRTQGIRRTSEEKQQAKAIKDTVIKGIDGLEKFLNNRDDKDRWIDIIAQLELLRNNIKADKEDSLTVANMYKDEYKEIYKNTFQRIKKLMVTPKLEQSLKKNEALLKERYRQELENQAVLEKGLKFSPRDKFIAGWETKKDDNTGTLYRSKLTGSELYAILRKAFPYVSKENIKAILSVRRIDNPNDRPVIWEQMDRVNIPPTDKYQGSEYKVDENTLNGIITRLNKTHDIPLQWIQSKVSEIKDLLRDGKSIYAIIGRLNREYTNDLKTEKQQKRNILINKAKELANLYKVPDSVNIESILKGFNWDIDKYKKIIQALLVKRIQKKLQELKDKTQNGTLISKEDYKNIENKIITQPFELVDDDKFNQAVDNAIRVYALTHKQQNNV